MTPALVSALAYLRYGWSVIPVRPGTNRPDLIPWREYQNRHATPDEVQGWYRQWPDANLAIVTGPISGLTVVDIDQRHGGVDSAKSLTLPRTWTVRTPHGWHLYYEYTPDLSSDSDYLPGIDVKNDGGCVTCEPSIRDGTRYRVIPVDLSTTPLSTPSPQLLPEATMHALLQRREAQHPKRENQAPRDPSWVTQALAGVGEGQRNETAARLAGYFHGRGLGADVILTILRPFAAACSPALPEVELVATVRSVGRYPTPGTGIVATFRGANEAAYLG